MTMTDLRNMKVRKELIRRIKQQKLRKTRPRKKQLPRDGDNALSVKNLKFKTLAELYGISYSTVKREVHFMLPRVYVAVCGNIRFPTSFENRYAFAGNHS